MTPGPPSPPGGRQRWAVLAVMNDSGGAQGPERAFITPLTGGQGPGGRRVDVPGKRPVADAGARERLTVPSLPLFLAFHSDPGLDYLELDLLVVGHLLN